MESFEIFRYRLLPALIKQLKTEINKILKKQPFNLFGTRWLEMSYNKSRISRTFSNRLKMILANVLFLLDKMNFKMDILLPKQR